MYEFLAKKADAASKYAAQTGWIRASRGADERAKEHTRAAGLHRKALEIAPKAERKSHAAMVKFHEAAALKYTEEAAARG